MGRMSVILFFSLSLLAKQFKMVLWCTLVCLLGVLTITAAGKNRLLLLDEAIGHTYIEPILAFIRGVFHSSTCRFLPSRKFYVRKDVNLTCFLHVNKIKGEVFVSHLRKNRALFDF